MVSCWNPVIRLVFFFKNLKLFTILSALFFPILTLLLNIVFVSLSTTFSYTAIHTLFHWGPAYSLEGDHIDRPFGPSDGICHFSHCGPSLFYLWIGRGLSGKLNTETLFESFTHFLIWIERIMFELGYQSPAAKYWRTLSFGLVFTVFQTSPSLWLTVHNVCILH